MTWGFTSRKEQDNSTASTEDAQQQQLSPKKGGRRRIGGRRRSEVDNSNSNTNDNTNSSSSSQKGVESSSSSGNNQEKTTTSGKKKSAPSFFGRSSKNQQQQQDSTSEQALRSSRMMNQKEDSTRSSASASAHYDDEHENINVDDSDEGQGIEILLNNNAKASSITKGAASNHNKGHEHHSRRSLSNQDNNNNHHHHRSAAPQRQDHNHASLLATTTTTGGVVSLEKDILPQRVKIYRAQFSVFFPVPTRAGQAAASSSSKGNKGTQHRIPLGAAAATTTGRSRDLSYNEVLQLLQNANPVDELTSVRSELKKTKAEVDALEEDKEGLNRRWKSLNQQQEKSATSTSTAGENSSNKEQLLSKQQHSLSAGLATDGVDWDIHRLLNSQRKMDVQERMHLEQTRGRCITVNLQNPRAEDAFLNKCCGAKQPVPKTTAGNRGVAATTMDPTNCRTGGAGATIRHLAVLPRGSSFFVSRDNGKSYSWGQLPSRLLQRMKTQGLDPVTHCGELMYLSTGPNGYYFAEFRSGECWWGCAGEDKEFYEILRQWEIYRVVFGSAVTHTTSLGQDIITNSWIILARDGRAAWKNLPSRLHHTLERRLANSAAPAEVALGSGESYYVRFLDGTVDYCLPSEVASVCEQIEIKGGIITDMAMNAEVSHEFMVRHRE